MQPSASPNTIEICEEPIVPLAKRCFDDVVVGKIMLVEKQRRCTNIRNLYTQNIKECTMMDNIRVAATIIIAFFGVAQFNTK